ncbi:MAG: 2-polyprenyl-6-methoxyphenol hydroxylase-like FAD-dependent oxidoreductase [Verrucomicrobiales bacterium]|jgi:2-polyprenyl-6-methoxyphenol hydroxylase-like FAD-dependent oxidoreductase
MEKQYDVVILGGGLAGLCLARQLLLYTDKTVLVVDREPKLPIDVQKVGESNVQVQGHYLARVLDLEEHLFHEQVMKYNLRFMWKTGDGKNFEDVSHSYIRHFSNIACYQLDRNKLEAHMIELNRENDRFLLLEGISDLDIDLKTGGNHLVKFGQGGEGHEITGNWVVDTSGRVRHLAGKMESKVKSEIRHSSAFFWTEGTCNIEKLTSSSQDEYRKRPERAELGHLPFWLATNHFCGEGYWFWVIPLHSRTSFGLVFDNNLIDVKDVNTEEKLLKWLFKEHPLFEHDLNVEKMIDFQVLHNYSANCERTISPDKWAMSGFSGRFTDPLYSPGGDAIAIYNTLIVDSIKSTDEELGKKINSYEAMMNTVYKSYVPSFHHSYNALGDQEAFSMKYVWELSIYFSYYVFPFINDLYTDSHFLIRYLNRFAKLGAMNRSLLIFISDYYEWKKVNLPKQAKPQFFEFKDVCTLKRAESTFYKVGLDSKAALEVLDEQFEHLQELAKFYIAHVTAVVTGEPDLAKSLDHVETIKLKEIHFDADEMKTHWSGIATSGEEYPWTIDAEVFSRSFHKLPA